MIGQGYSKDVPGDMARAWELAQQADAITPKSRLADG